MRRQCLHLVWVCIGWTSLAAGAEKAPYTAYINADDVYVRSGPGQSYYPTSKLKLGQAIEVYRHDPGGWFAVRPPEGSFSWVSAKYLQEGKDGIAVVTGDRVVARVGSELSDIRDVIQVRLDRGEEVEILETLDLESGNGPQTWCKVAPVAGEFRWVLGKYLDRDPPTALAKNGDPRRNLLLAKRDADRGAASGLSKSASLQQERDADDDAGSPADEGAAEQSSHGGFRPLRKSGSSNQETQTAASRTNATRPAQPTSFQKQSALESANSAAARGSAKQSPSRTTANPLPRGEQFRAAIDEIDLAISNMIVEDPSAWSFDEVREQAEAALSQAQTAVERGHARLLLGKIARFEDIQARYGSVAAGPANLAPDQPISGTSRDAASNLTAVPRRPEPPRFDGTGRLANVLSQRVGAPQYALLDEAGAIRMYVSAAPGGTLKQYVGQHVGIVGVRGFHSQMNAAHVTARQVSVLR